MGDTHYLYPVALQWKENPESLKKLKNKLLLYFQKRSESNGGECEIRDTDCSRGHILIYFKEEKDRDRVLQKDSHELKLSRGKKMKLDVRSVGTDSEWSPPVGSQSSHAEEEISGDKAQKIKTAEEIKYHQKKALFVGKKGLQVSDSDSDTLRIEKPGAKKFCKANEEVHAATARRNHHCVIRLEETDVENDLFGKSLFQVILPNGMTLSVYKDDLCRHNVDVIVNAANEQLRHGGGLAKAILDAAGRKLQDDCNQIIRKNGRLSTGDSVITDAGKLLCKQIIHTVGPRWNSNSHSRCEQLLRKAITTSLQLASKNSHSSIAIPAVSSGFFGFPLKLCVENIVEAIRNYAETTGQQSTLQRIHLVDINDKTINTFCEVIKAKFGNQTSAVPSTAIAPQPIKRAAQSPPAPVDRGNDNTVMTKEGMKIKLLQKNIEDCSTTASQLAINTEAATSGATNKQSAGTGSRVSKATLEAAGPSVVSSASAQDEDSHSLPSHWEQMGKTLVMEVDVVPETPEYSNVQLKFQGTCRNQILKILRVQNRDLWLQYQIKKQNINSKNGPNNNERELFHGTDFDSIQHVNQYGFNRSYTGRNAAAYGKGTYFAVNANYVADDAYSKPDVNGERHMYLTRVLTGLYCVGSHGMITPPAKNTANPTDLYDSVTDNAQNPSMFVIFNDIQAYPEYHIIFQ